MTQAPVFEVHASAGFGPWLRTQGCSLTFTTYQAGKVFFIGTHESGELALFERSFPRCMGVAVGANSMWLATRFQLWRFENALGASQTHGAHDRVFVPQVAFTTGDLDVHDVVVDKEGRPVFVATGFNCLATTSQTHSFRPVWRPPWISDLVGEDRCHLNGLAVKHGRPAYATAVSRSDVVDGWRKRRSDGGVVVAIDSDEVVCEGLSMPHSPRVRGDEIWLLEAGSGYLGRVDPKRRSMERVAFCPGFARGLTIIGDRAVVGLSAARENRNFSGLEFDENLKRKDADARCGLVVVNLETGRIEHTMWIEGVVRELYDVAVIPGALRPMAIGIQNDDIHRVISVDYG